MEDVVLELGVLLVTVLLVPLLEVVVVVVSCSLNNIMDAGWVCDVSTVVLLIDGTSVSEVFVFVVDRSPW